MATGPLTTLHVIRNSGPLVLVAESYSEHSDCQSYEVIAVASTLEEAREFAAEDNSAADRTDDGAGADRPAGPTAAPEGSAEHAARDGRPRPPLRADSRRVADLVGL